MQREIPIWVGIIILVAVIAVAVFILWRGTEVRKVKEEPMAPLKMMQKYGAPGPGAAPSPAPMPGR